MIFRKLLFLLLFIPLISKAQKYPKDYFDSPLKIPIVLSGTFGELRNNHFHSGVDIKTQQRIGIPIYAPADGYVSRIKVSLYGYGKALYINHQNGFTTVYAHLSKYGSEIESYVKNIQYEKENYQTGNVYPKSDELLVKKGQIIGYTGDTGGFVYPHLHYEFRDTKTEYIINPMHFGLLPKDTKAPSINSLMVYPLTNNARVNSSASKQVIALKKQNDSTYISERIKASGRIGLALNTFDRLNGANNKNGVYSVTMKINGKQVYYHDLETFSFSETNLINLFIDYSFYKKYKRRYQKTYLEEKNSLSIYKNVKDKGVILVEPKLNYRIELQVKDFVGNVTTVKVPVKGVPSNTIFNKKDTTAFHIKHNELKRFTIENVSVAFPKNTFYRDAYLDLSVENGIAKIHKDEIPLAKRYTLTFDTSQLTELEKKQVYIANVNNKKYPRYQNTRKRTNKIFTTTKTLGNYSLLFDNQKPKISILNLKNEQWVSKLNKIKVKITDSQSGIKNYKAYIDNEWVLLEPDLKKSTYVYNFSDKKLVGAKHIFKIVVSDNVGNTNTLSATFYRK